MKSTNIEYVGKDLEAMDFAVGYHKWILESMAPYIGKHLVEVGAGTGSFSELLIQMNPESITLVEPSHMFETLHGNFYSRSINTNITLYRDTFREVAEPIKTKQPPDSVFYVNVLEHIDDDDAELRSVHDTLAENGRVFIFVPALPFLYSSFDRQIGHFRRYTRSGLRKKCEAAGFKLLMLRWFDFIGIAPWFLKYRLLGSLSMESKAIRVYDKLVVPVAKSVENMIEPPAGKNLIVIAERN